MLGFGTFVAPVGVEDPRFKKPDEEVQEKLSLDDLLRPENVKIMKDTMKDWSGPHIDRLSDEDLRSSFHDDYSSFFNKISTTNTDFDFTDYDMIICDDNRNTPKTIAL